jgi:hypothetical protein
MRNLYAKARALSVAGLYAITNEMLICIKASVNLQAGAFCTGKKLS